jgi:hypothetical protein
VSPPHIAPLRKHLGEEISDEKAFINHVYSTSLLFFSCIEFSKRNGKSFPEKFLRHCVFLLFIGDIFLRLSLEGLEIIYSVAKQMKIKNFSYAEL